MSAFELRTPGSGFSFGFGGRRPGSNGNAGHRANGEAAQQAPLFANTHVARGDITRKTQETPSQLRQVSPIAFDLDDPPHSNGAQGMLSPLILPAQYKDNAYTAYPRSQNDHASVLYSMRRQVSMHVDMPPYSPGDMSVLSVRSDVTSGNRTPTREKIFSEISSTFDILGNAEKRLQAINDALADVGEQDPYAVSSDQQGQGVQREQTKPFIRLQTAIQNVLHIDLSDGNLSQTAIERLLTKKLTDTDTKAHINTLEVELSSFKGQLTDREHDLAEMRRRYEESLHDARDLQNKLVAFGAMSVEWERKQQAFAGEIQLLYQENGELAERADTFQAQAADHKCMAEAHKREITALKSQLSTSLSQLNFARGETQSLEDIEKRMNIGEQTNKELAKELTQVKAEKQALTEELDQLLFAKQDDDGQMQSLKTRCDSLLAEQNMMRESIRAERVENVKAKQTLSDKVIKLEDELEAKTFENHNLQNELSQSRRESGKVHSQIEMTEKQMVDFQQKIQELEIKLKDTQQENESNKQQIVQLKEQVQQADQLQLKSVASPSKIEQRINQLTEAKEQFEDKYKGSIQQKEKMSRYLDEAIKREHDLKEKLVNAENARTEGDKRTLELQSRLTELKQIARRKDEDLFALKSLFERTTVETKDVHGKFERVYGEKEQLAVLRHDLEQQLQQTRFELDRATQSCSQKDKDLAEYQIQLRVLQDDVSQLKTSYQTTANTKTRLEAMKRDLEQKVKNLEHSNASQLELLETTRKDLEKTTARLVESEDKYRKLQKLHMTAEEKQSESKRQTTDLRAELEEIRRKLETLTLSSNGLQDDYRNIVDQHKTLQNRYDAKQQEQVDAERRHKSNVDVHKTKLQESLTRLNELDKSLMELRQQFLQVTEEKNRLVTECERLQGKLSRMSQSKGYQEEKLSKSEESYANLKHKLQKREKELKELRIEESKYRGLYESVTSSLTQVEREKFGHSQHNDRLKEELLLAQVRVEDFETKTARYEKEIVELKQSMRELEGERERYAKLYKRTEQEGFHRRDSDQREKQEVDSQLAALGHENQKLEQQVRSLEAHVNKLKENLSSAREETIQAAVVKRMNVEQYEAKLAKLKQEKGDIDHQVHLVKDEVASVPSMQKTIAELEIALDKSRHEKLTLGVLMSHTIQRLLDENTDSYIDNVRLVRENEKSESKIDLIALMTALTQIIGYHNVKRHELESKLAIAATTGGVDQLRSASRSGSPINRSNVQIDGGHKSGMLLQLKEQYTKIHADHQTFVGDVRKILRAARQSHNIKLTNDLQDLASTGEIVEALDVIVQHLTSRGTGSDDEIERLNAQVELRNDKIKMLTENLEETREQLRELCTAQEHADTNKSLLEIYNTSLRRELSEARKDLPKIETASTTMDPSSMKALKRQVLSSLQHAQSMLDECVNKGLMRTEHLEDVTDIRQQIDVLQGSSMSQTLTMQAALTGIKLLESAVGALYKRFSGKFKDVLETIAIKKEKQVSALQIQLATLKEELQRYQTECDKLRQTEFEKSEKLMRLSMLVERGETLRVKAERKQQIVKSANGGVSSIISQRGDNESDGGNNSITFLKKPTKSKGISSSRVDEVGHRGRTRTYSRHTDLATTATVTKPRKPHHHYRSRVTGDFTTTDDEY